MQSGENKARILFVEDEKILREHLAEQLSGEYDVETAGDGEQALLAVLRRRPDLIITDLLMPALDGIELVKTLRNTPSTATIPILMISGRAADEVRLEGFKFGADAFLAKPYTERELRIRIQSMLQAAQLRNEVARQEAEKRAEDEAVRERAALLESISDAFYAVDRDWRVRYANQRALDHFSMSREDLIGKVLWDAIPVGRGTRLEEEYRRVMVHRRPAALEAISPLTGRWIEVHVYPTPQGVAVNFRDITERKRSEEALRDSEARLRAAEETLRKRADKLEQTVQAAIADRDRAWNNTQDLLLILDTDGTFRAANPAWSTLLGWQPEDVVGRGYLEFTHPDDHDVSRDSLSNATRHPLKQFSIRIRARDGSYRSVSWVAAPEGDLIYASGRDITAELAAIEALEQANARSRAVFETSYQYQGFLAPDGTLLDANQASLAGIGRDLNEVVGTCFWRAPWFVDTPGMPAAIEADVRRVAAGEPVRREISVNLPVGPRILDLSMRPVFDERRQVIGIVHESIDVTERKHAAEQLAQMQKMESIGQLTGGVAHDFNNLLTPIVGALDMLHRKMAGDPKFERLTAGALQAADRARLLIQRLLAFARKQHLEARAVDISALLSSITELFARTLGPQIDISTEVAERLPLARVDANQLELALLNLALNARDAMPSGGSLHISADTQWVQRHPNLVPGAYVRILVTDSGHGMDEVTLSRAIEPFYTTKPAGQGTGLGLSMVHGLAAQSGGDLALVSAPGQGTTATLWLPVSSETAESEALQVTTPEPSRASAARSVLVVDDEDLVRATTAAMLTDAGYVVVEAASAAQALSLLKGDLKIDALVTDYAMPGVTGAQLARMVRVARADLPVLMITGFANLSDQEAGGYPRLAKPFRQVDIVAVLGDLLKQAARAG